MLLCLFLGHFGMHAFYVGKYKQGAFFIGAFLLSLFALIIGGCVNWYPLIGVSIAGIFGWLALGLVCVANAFWIGLGKYKDCKGRLIKKWF